jgi:hypothetical protein
MGSAATGDLAAVRAAPVRTVACGPISAAVGVQATEKLAAFAPSSWTRTATTRVGAAAVGEPCGGRLRFKVGD